MTKLRTFAVAVALSVAATVAMAQPAANTETQQMAAPSAADPQVRDHVLATVKAARTAKPPSSDMSSPRGQNSVASGASPSTAPLRGTPPAQH
jgi:hypothetical protein